MKKRFLTFILTIATMLMCIFGLSACGGNVEFKINFVVENEIYATVSTSGNEVISMPENPTKDDYTFDGWYWDENTWEKPFTANSLLDAPLSSDMKVYAKFNKNHTHEYTPTTTEPTCTEKGLITYTCSCGDSYTEDIPAIGHDEKTHEAKAPTCTEIGWEEYVTCERDGCGYSTYKEIPATGVHTWDKGEETKAPTCTKEGETTYTCMVCKTATKTEPIDKLRHEYAEKWTSNATYHWHECKCGDKDGEEKHTAGAPATATTPQTCTVCGYVLQAETGILFNTLTVEGTKVYGKVSNDTEIFSFINEITVKGNATYVIDVNMSCNDPIESKTVELSVGDNKFYVLEKIGNDVKLFTVTIRRRPMYEVTFNANGGTSVEKQVIEEDYLATEPETTRTGYTFTGWDYDFTQAITENTKITASWSANKDTKYTVNYYLQNLDDSNYTLHESVELKGETDTTATADIKEYTHFTFNQGYYKNALSGNINPEGNRVLSVYYTRDTYSIVANNNNAKAGTSTQINDTYKYDKEFTLTATTNAGYTWLGWYDGENLACETEEFTFKVEKDVTYTATWSANTDTKYTVIYYLQNLEDDNYTPYETVELKGETDTPTAEVDIREYTHFTYNASKSTISGNIDGDGNRVLSVYYTRNTYAISVNNTSYGSITNRGTYKYGKEITSTASVKLLGYEFIGWYSGEELLSTDATYTFTVDKTVTAKFAVKEEMSNFNFTSTATACSITGLKDKTITEIVVPDYVTSISQGAFKGCSSLESITIPFVGGSRKTASDTYQYPFGYIFGTSNYTGGTATRQYYYGSSTSSTTSTTYYIPTSLKAVTVTGGDILRGAFYNCSNLTNVIIGDGVTSIGNYPFAYCSSLTNVTIGDGVTSIADWAFAYCDSLTSVTCPAFAISYILKSNIRTVVVTSGDSIGNSAFYNCSSLMSITIPDSVTSIGAYAFYDCDSLTSVVIPDSVTSIGAYAFYDCDSLTSITIPDSVTSIGKNAFYNCDSLTSMVIGSNVTSIGDYAFSWCDSLTTITVREGNENYQSIDGNLYTKDGKTLVQSAIGKPTTLFVVPDSVTTIGNGAFINFDNLTNVVIGDSVTSIGAAAFRDCGSLASITIPDSVASIGAAAFRDCGSLASITIPDSVASIGDSAFRYCDSLTSIEIPNSVTSIGNYAFESCSGLINVVIGDGVTLIGKYAFSGCSSLARIAVGASVMNVDFYAFEGCESLTGVYITDLTAWCYISFGTYDANPLYYAGNLYLNNELVTELEIPDSVTSIGGGAFYNCSSLTSVEIGDSVTSIGNSAFCYCDSLTSVEIGDSVTSIGDGAFENCISLTSVVIGDSVTSIGDEAFWRCCKLVEVVNKSTHITVTKDDSSNGYVGYYALAVYNSGDTFETKLSNDNGYIIYTDGNEKILVGYNGTETDLVLPSYITKINQYAFYDCDSLTSIEIPDSVTSIGAAAFYNCSSLTSVVIGDSVTTIAPFAFENCDSLTSVEIGDSVTSIGNSAFENCSSLTSVVIGDSVTSIGYYAFENCDSLTSITFKGTTTQWGKISKAYSWDYNVPATYVQCTDGKVSI